MDAIEVANALRPASFFGVLFALLAWERFRPFRKPTKALKPRWLINGKLTVLNFLFTAIVPITLVGIAAVARSYELGLLNILEAPLAATVIVSVLARSFISYLAHYLAHKVPVLWSFHQVHHLDEDIDVTTTVRFHPFEVLLILAVGAPITLLLGLDPLTLALYDLIKAPVNVLSHANLNLPRFLDSWCKYLIVTPTVHRVHHCSDQRYTDSNYSDLFPVWDLVFGTFSNLPMEQQKTMSLGLDTARQPKHEKLSWLLWPWGGRQ